MRIMESKYPEVFGLIANQLTTLANIFSVFIRLLVGLGPKKV
jgi:hypothetical protein